VFSFSYKEKLSLYINECVQVKETTAKTKLS